MNFDTTINRQQAHKDPHRAFEKGFFGSMPIQFFGLGHMPIQFP
jgi:hypothetical protein